MSGPLLQSAPHEHSFEAHGVRVAVGASDPELLRRVLELLPAGIQPCAPETVERRFVVWTEEAGWRYDSGAGRSLTVTDPALAIAILDAELRSYVASRAPGRIFIHAGSVAHGGQAIVIPGSSFSGKSTLVAALARAGAVYYSDEYAVLDDRGLVHPYARALSIGTDHGPADGDSIESLGGTVGVEPVPIGLIVVTRYRPGASWSPERRSAGQGMLALVTHAMPVRQRPKEALASARRAASNAIVLEGDRGEADVAAAALMEVLAGSAASETEQP